MTRSWGQLSPYNGAISFGATPGVPETCQLSQAHGLYRHTERYPTSYYLEGGETEAFWSQVEAYRKAHPNGTIATGPLSFLNHWQYMFGEVDVLLPSGTATAQSAGASFWSQYGRLVYRAGPNVPSWNASLNVASNGTARPKPVFRTTTESRILESARWWLSKFIKPHTDKHASLQK
jgi:3-phytase